jgi:alpha-beta hydrolase superfamily lysophospholipase
MYRYFEINEHGHNVRCKIYCRDLKSIRKVVVFGHGFGGHKDNSAAEKFAERMISKYKNSALITFNWPAHGDDVKRNLRLDDCVDYLALVVDYVQQKYTDEIYAYATSFGAYLTLLYLHSHGSPFRKIALRCPAVDMHELLTTRIMAAEDTGKLKKGRDILVGFDRKVPVSAAFLEELKANSLRALDFLDFAEDILILHGTADEIAPFDSAVTFAEDQLIELIPIEGADHRFRDPRKMDQAMKCILEHFSF